MTGLRTRRRAHDTHAAAAALPVTLRDALTAFESQPEDEAARTLGLRRGELRTLVFDAREELAAAGGLVFTGCRPVRAEIAVAPDAVVRRERVRRHVLECRGCAAWAEEVERQRDALGAAPAARVVPGRRRTTSRDHSRVRRGVAAVAVSAVAATAGYLGVGALQGGGAPGTPEAPAAAAAEDTPKAPRAKAGRRTTSTAPAPVAASAVTPEAPPPAPVPAAAPAPTAKPKEHGPRKQRGRRAKPRAAFAPAPAPDHTGDLAVDDR